MHILKSFTSAILASFLLLSATSAQDFEKSVSRPVVDMIAAKPVSTNKIRVTWKVPKDFSAEALLVYKSTRPFNSASAISQSTPVAQLSPKALSYTDTVINYKEYYYAVIARVSDGSLYNIVLPSINTTVKGVKVSRPAKSQEPSEEDLEASKEKIYQAGTIRELPLPYLDLIENTDKKPVQLKDEVVKAGKDLAQGHSAPPPEKLAPYFFDEDMISPAGGDEYFLFEILKNYFVKKDYKGSAKALKEFLSVNRNTQVTNRAVFYLGEAQYYSGNYRQALTMFLFVEESYPVLSKKWINSTLDFYKAPVKYDF